LPRTILPLDNKPFVKVAIPSAVKVPEVEKLPFVESIVKRLEEAPTLILF